jgi:hypothetical protein
MVIFIILFISRLAHAPPPISFIGMPDNRREQRLSPKG